MQATGASVAGKTEKKKTPIVVRKDKKVGPNDPCPCGSGKKYKKCCGSVGNAQATSNGETNA